MAMPTISALNVQAAEAWSGRTPSERRLLAGLALVALTVMPIKASGLKTEAAEKQADVAAQLDRARMVARRSQGSVGGQLTSERNQVRSWSWQAESAEVGKVLVQTKVVDMAEEAGLTEIEVKLGDKVDQAGGILLVPLELTANFNWSGLSGLLAALEGSGRGFVLDSVQMPDSDKPRLKISLRAPLAVTPARATGGAT